MASLNGANSRPGAAVSTQAPVMPNIMEALANIARQNASTPAANPPATAATPAYGLAGSISNGALPAPTPAPVVTSQPSLPGFPGLPFLPMAQPAAPAANPLAAIPGMPFAFPPQSQPAQPALPGAVGAPQGQAPGWPVNPTAPAASAPPAVAPNPSLDPKVQQQLMLIQTLAAQGIPLDKITQLLQVMGNNNVGTPAPAASVPPPQHMPQPVNGYAAPAAWEAPRPDGARDHNAYHDTVRSPNRRRSRSRSPPRWDYQGNRDGGRGGYNNYGNNSPNGRDRGGRDTRSSEYRQRSPMGRRGFSPEEEPPAEKWVEYDPKLANGTIKVLSRTLFVGGVTCSEQELRQIFSRFGKVQTCIVNKDKRHAFVKMYYRKDALKAKEGMDEHRNADLPLRTRWGVGFGPRDCSDYQTGVSIIPIHKLTDADRKWMLTAPFGGSGGRPIVTGLCVEEPDIEIGAGVSSKAISRRMQTDKGGNQGPRSSRDDDNPNHMPPAPTRGAMAGRGGADSNQFRRGARGDGRGTGRREERERDSRPNNGANEEPVVLGFPPGITMGPNGINFPPGFNFGQNGSS
ncbi:hypothetical protein DL546_003463 [Coniochaeta pulveracea]|nr:hypothetical protein DL546_003463 [Coniochaeta pulveracea]